MASVASFQPSQSSSARPSSMEKMGYLPIHASKNATISLAERLEPSDFLKTYWPFSKYSLAAGSSARTMSSPAL